MAIKKSVDDISDEQVLNGYGKYLKQIMHIYMGYGYLTAKMAAYALDIPVRFAYRFTVFVAFKTVLRILVLENIQSHSIYYGDDFHFWGRRLWMNILQC